MFKNIKTIIILLFAATSINAQHFEGTFTNTGSKLVFKIKPVGGNITESITYIDFNIRYAPSLNITYNNIVNNSADFAGLNIQQAPERQFNGKKYKRFVHNTGTVGLNTYVQNTEYVVFSVDLLDMVNTTGDFELVTDLASEINFPNDYIFSVNNSIGLPITDQTAPFNYFYDNQTNPVGSEYVLALNNVLLPVDLRKFEANANLNNITLNWVAIFETNLSGYEIYKSYNLRNFDEIGFIKFDEKKKGEYTFIDNNVNVNTDYYYKLKVVDIDGNFEFTGVKHAIINSDYTNEIIIYPNPTSEYFYINTQVENVSEIDIYDLNGNSVKSQIDIVQQSSNKYYINCKNIISGTYLIKISGKMKKIFILN